MKINHWYIIACIYFISSTIIWIDLLYHISETSKILKINTKIDSITGILIVLIYIVGGTLLFIKKRNRNVRFINNRIKGIPKDNKRYTTNGLRNKQLSKSNRSIIIRNNKLLMRIPNVRNNKKPNNKHILSINNVHNLLASSTKRNIHTSNKNTRRKGYN